MIRPIVLQKKMKRIGSKMFTLFINADAAKQSDTDWQIIRFESFRASVCTEVNNKHDEHCLQ